eukprot:6563810-Ditylum_brightwellii.AAC.1
MEYNNGLFFLHANLFSNMKDICYAEECIQCQCIKWHNYANDEANEVVAEYTTMDVIGKGINTGEGFN